MDRLLRLEKLKSFFSACGKEISGRKKIHKLVYLTQALGVNMGQEFIFHYYGVYSPSLSGDLQQAKNWDILTENRVGTLYKYKLKEGMEKPGDETIQEKREIINELARKTPAVLEVLSTMVYLHRMDYPKEEIKNKITELKGHLSSFFSEATGMAHKYFDI